MFYGEGRIDFHFETVTKNSNSPEGTRLDQRAGELAIGWSRWIVPNIALDVQLGSSWSERDVFNLGRLEFVSKAFMRIGMECYL